MAHLLINKCTLVYISTYLHRVFTTNMRMRTNFVDKGIESEILKIKKCKCSSFCFTWKLKTLERTTPNVINFLV